jgi:hypothetical protein
MTPAVLERNTAPPAPTRSEELEHMRDYIRTVGYAAAYEPAAPAERVPAVAPRDLENVSRKWRRARSAPKVLQECGELGARSLWVSDAERRRIAQGPGSGAAPTGKWAEQLERRLVDPREKLWLAQQASSSGVRRLEYTGERSSGVELELETPWREPSAHSRQHTNSVSALRAARSGEKAQPVGAEQVALHEEANKIAEKLRGLRKMRYAMRDVLRRKSLQPRLQNCGTTILPSSTGVSIALGEFGAHFSGLMACGSVWSCPCCAPKIAQERQGMVDQLLRRHLQRHSTGVPSDELESGGALCLTLTVSHRWGDELRKMRQAVSLVHRKLWSQRAGKALRARWGIIGHVRSLEVTHGRNGWHPHLHCIVLTEGLLSASEAELLRVELAERWCDLAEKAKLTRPLEEQQHAELVHSPEDAARYITKYGAAAELTGWTNKDARAGGRTPFQILADYLREGKRHDIYLWQQWERDIKGACFLTWSRGLKRKYLIVEKTDQEIADAEERRTTPVIIINDQLFLSLVSLPHIRAELLDTAEREGGWAVAELLESLPGLRKGARILAIYDSAALDRLWSGARTPPEGGLTLALRSPDCILYETRVLPSLTITELQAHSAARKGAT